MCKKEAKRSSTLRGRENWSEVRGREFMASPVKEQRKLGSNLKEWAWITSDAQAALCTEQGWPGCEDIFRLSDSPSTGSLFQIVTGCICTRSETGNVLQTPAFRNQQFSNLASPRDFSQLISRGSGASVEQRLYPLKRTKTNNVCVCVCEVRTLVVLIKNFQINSFLFGFCSYKWTLRVFSFGGTAGCIV